MKFSIVHHPESRETKASWSLAHDEVAQKLPTIGASIREGMKKDSGLYYHMLGDGKMVGATYYPSDKVAGDEVHPAALHVFVNQKALGLEKSARAIADMLRDPFVHAELRAENPPVVLEPKHDLGRHSELSSEEKVLAALKRHFPEVPKGN